MAKIVLNSLMKARYHHLHTATYIFHYDYNVSPKAFEVTYRYMNADELLTVNYSGILCRF